MSNLTRAERIAFNADFNRYYKKDEEAEQMRTLTDDMMNQALTDAALFRSYDDDYEVIDRDQVQRALRNLDNAIFSFNQFALVPDEHRVAIDSVFTALRIMQDNLRKAVEHEAEKAMNSRQEMACFGED